MTRASRVALAIAAVWLVFGAAIAIASWRMDRLADRSIEPWSAPGLTPGIIGALIAMLAVVLAWQAWRAAPGDVPADATGNDNEDLAVAGSWRRTGTAGALCVLFAGITLGSGVPFVVEGAVFVFVFTALFSWSSWRAEHRVGRGVAQTLAIAIVACVLISGLFERVFLVRLP